MGVFFPVILLNLKGNFQINCSKCEHISLENVTIADILNLRERSRVVNIHLLTFH